MNIELLVWGIPLLPFAGFLVNGFWGRKMPKTIVSVIGCGTVFGSFVLSLMAFQQVRTAGKFVSTVVPCLRRHARPYAQDAKRWGSRTPNANATRTPATTMRLDGVQGWLLAVSRAITPMSAIAMPIPSSTDTHAAPNE